MTDLPDTDAESGDVLEPRDLMALVLAKSWILVVAIALCVGAGLAYLKWAVPIYKAKATVEVLMNSRNVAGMEIQGLDGGSAEALATVEANLQRPSLFQKVMEREEIAAHPELGLPDDLSSFQQALEMTRWTTVGLRRGARLIDISVEHSSAEVATLLVTGIFEEYIRERLQIDSGSSRSAFEMLLVEKREIDERLESLEAGQQSIEKVLAAKEAILTLQGEIEVLLQTKGALHPDVKARSSALSRMYDDLEALVDKARPLLEKRGEEAAGGGLAATTGGGAPTREEGLLNRADELELVRLSLLRDIDSERVLGELIVARLKESEITMDIQTVPLALVEPAYAPAEPVSPQPIKILGVATVLGGGLGLFAIGILYFLNSTINTVEEAERLIGLPILGVIPHDKRLPDRQWLEENNERELAQIKQATNDADSGEAVAHRQPASRGKLEPLVLLSDPGCPVAEAFRTLRATLGLRVGGQGLNTCLVVSAVPGEGKSFVAANLAVGMAAQTTRRTLLIDADLRCPTMQVVFDLGSDHAGLSEALRERGSEPESFVVPSGVANLDILPAGYGTRNPAELLSSPNLAVMLEKLGAAYDRIVIDAAPVNVVADGLLLAPLVDSVLLVARAGQTRRESVIHAAQMLSEGNCPLTGLVLNQVEKCGGDASNPYSSKDLRKFQNYGENYR